MNKRRLIITTLVVVLIVLAGVAVLPAAKRHVEAVNCSNQMHSILCVASLLWPDEHDGHLPSNFISMSNELATTKILICPADHARRPAVSWLSVSSEHCSYEMVTPGLGKTDTNTVFIRCRIHGYTGYSDDRLLDASGRLVQPQRLW